MAINDWSTNPANNTLVGSINWSEGQLPGTVNGSARQMMADVASWRDSLAASASTYALAAGQIFSGRVGRDTNFYLDILGGHPILNFDANSFFDFDRTAKTLTLTINGQQRMVAREVGDFSLSGTGALKFNSDFVWTSGNDGAGSGMDADLLDGQQGAFYADIPGRLGYTPANKGGDTFSGDVQVVKSGNASLIVNSSGAVVGKLVAQPDATVAFYRNTGGGDVSIWFANASGMNVATTLRRAGNLVWDAGNDGAGSGLDADLLDGYQGGDYVRVTSSNLSASGHRVFADGMKEQWGNVTVPANSSTVVSFPIAHTSWVNPVFGTGVVADSSASENIGLINLTTSNMTIYNAENVAIPVYWQTKGV